MFPKSSILSDLDAQIIPIGSRAYIGQRAKNKYYDYVMGKFRDSGLSQATLARRMGRGPAQINRMLANPGNWTIETVAELLACICGEELIPYSVSFRDRAISNSRQDEVTNTANYNKCYNNLSVVSTDVNYRMLSLVV